MFYSYHRLIHRCVCNYSVYIDIIVCNFNLEIYDMRAYGDSLLLSCHHHGIVYDEKSKNPFHCFRRFGVSLLL